MTLVATFFGFSGRISRLRYLCCLAVALIASEIAQIGYSQVAAKLTHGHSQIDLKYTLLLVMCTFLILVIWNFDFALGKTTS